MNQKLLVVEDEPAYRDALVFRLRQDGFEVFEAASGPDALRQAAVHQPDLILLDLMLPGLSGEEVCRRLRDTSDAGIIMLTAKDEEVDKIVGLELGADDYVTKPYSYRELLARVRAVLRRRLDTTDIDEVPAGEVLSCGNLIMDTGAHEVRVGQTSLELPLREFELLQYLLENAGRVLTRAQLLDSVWGLDFIGDPKTLDVHIKRLRNRVEADPSKPTLIITVRGLGYKLVPPAS